MHGQLTMTVRMAFVWHCEAVFYSEIGDSPKAS